MFVEKKLDKHYLSIRKNTVWNFVLKWSVIFGITSNLKMIIKTITSSLIFLLFSFIANAQIDTSIIGVWKVVSISNQEIYYNYKNDSVSLSRELQALYPDKSEQQKLCMGLKVIVPVDHFHFRSDGIFKQFMDTILNFEGTYKDLPSQKIIELTTKNSFDQNVTEKLNYVIKNGLLYLTMAWYEGEFNLVLDRHKL